jgi:hypothetical protein
MTNSSSVFNVKAQFHMKIEKQFRIFFSFFNHSRRVHVGTWFCLLQTSSFAENGKIFIKIDRDAWRIKHKKAVFVQPTEKAF